MTNETNTISDASARTEQRKPSALVNGAFKSGKSSAKAIARALA